MRFRRESDLRALLEAESKRRMKRPLFSTDHVQGVHKGVFFRIKIPSSETKILPGIPPMPLQSSLAAPKAFTPLDPVEARHTSEDAFHQFRRRAAEWWNLNWPTLVLNIGSIVSLIGFTRSDVLELRVLSVTGSLAGVMYHVKQVPVRPVPIAWALTFATVNAYFIRNIYKERTSSVRLTREQEEIYDTHFLQHGVTPKQFELLYSKAELLKFAKDRLIIRQGEKMNHVYLVVKGNTRASVLGRRLSAVSISDSKVGDEDEHREATPGAWIGEMSFLELFWMNEQAKKKITKRVKQGGESHPIAVQPRNSKPSGDSLAHRRTIHAVDVPMQPPKMSHSFYTIVATDDCTVLRWSHKDMEEIMASSVDMKSAMNRAMTAAIIAKVINFTVSRSKARIPQWSSWLDEMKYGSYSSTHAESQPTNDNGIKQVHENLPTYDVH